MAFKTVKSYNEEKFGGLFVLKNDGDTADVIFLYQSPEDVLVADVHYLKSGEYSGYAHCLSGKNCPACVKGIRVQTKLFIPVFNIQANEIQFFDRTMRFEPQLQKDVFSRYPNPSEYVFRITRHGEAGSVDTTYEIVAVGKNTYKSYSQILAENNATMPEYYENICRSLSAAEMQDLLVSGDKPTNAYEVGNYGAVPRTADALSTNNVPDNIPDMPDPGPINIPEYSAPPEYIPPVQSVTEGENGSPADAEELGEPEF